MFKTFLLWAISFIFVSIFRQRSRYKRPQSDPYHDRYPPGPSPLPFIGNFFDVPRFLPWITYTIWRRKYGDLVHITALGQHIFILNSVKTATDLLEKRSRNYSDRPYIPMVDLTGWDINMTVMHYGVRWRTHRRVFHQKFRPDAVSFLKPIIFVKMRELLRNLLCDPEAFATHARNYPASIIMYTTYGHNVAGKDDRLVRLADDATIVISEGLFSGAQPVNVFPILRFVPSWMPGAGFKRHAQRCRMLLDKMQDVPLRAVKERMAKGTAIPSWTTDLLEKARPEEDAREREDVVKAVTATAFAAGTDTTAASMTSFILAMALFPEVAQKAQSEIDTLVGNDRLPDFEDREHLPFVEALCRELRRWRPPVPLGIPHAALEDDFFDGYFIPKGSTILTNIWAMCHDEAIFPEPDQFKPERFLMADGRLTDNYSDPAFGFGRRICVGRSLADAAMWIAIVSILAAFDISHARDEVGRALDLSKIKYSTGVISHPPPFKCSIAPRSIEKRGLVAEIPLFGIDAPQLHPTLLESTSSLYDS